MAASLLKRKRAATWCPLHHTIGFDRVLLCWLIVIIANLTEGSAVKTDLYFAY
jgi:hypothetical protein